MVRFLLYKTRRHIWESGDKTPLNFKVAMTCSWMVILTPGWFRPGKQASVRFEQETGGASKPACMFWEKYEI
jgi:hypothetical protein